MDQGLQATQISAGGTYTACPDAESPHADDSMGKLEVKKKRRFEDVFERFQKYKRRLHKFKKERADPWNQNKGKGQSSMGEELVANRFSLSP